MLQNTLDALLARHFTANTPGAVLLVAKGKEVIYLGSRGLANLQTVAAITPDTTFRLASVSKQFTAMCVHLLAQQGHLQLTDRLSLYFPELRHLEGVRLLHLLNHTSGLPDFEEHIPESQQAQLTDEDVLQLTAQQQALLFPSGSQYRYSNTAYVLLGLLAERVSGKNYANVLQEYIFKPLEMQHSMLYRVDALIPNRAMGYRQANNGDFILSDQNIGTATRGDGCIYTSALDYLKWWQALESNFLFNITNQLKTTTSSIDDAKGWKYSMGWFVSDLGNGKYEYCHSGDTSGFTNLVLWQPEHDTLVACFSNTAQNHTFLGELLQELKSFTEYSPKSELVYHLQELTR
ncbi:serine hydrolase domain-containing protein [Pontibacter chinhatensis]|uniref:CubicO group peptidase, beta-lactamase class C family n=1 Tax=Pontibacter chinhatensis TaxID=1436961 RepID=A0A1I2NF27_9BACT|nr:serine hydrolase domain-containing protein [Pontibacter chinhatensis]SFG02494.1 CubicO group peptidase, beta-lactamase class C family [Pontibacter chinhatensis]